VIGLARGPVAHQKSKTFCGFQLPRRNHNTTQPRAAQRTKNKEQRTKNKEQRKNSVMGAGASMETMASIAPYPTIEAALADGKSQAEINAFLAVSPAQQENIVYAHAAVAAIAAEQ
jgi:hypothetical protein